MKRRFALLPVLACLAACTSLGSVQLNANKAFLTAQIAFKSSQQTALATCSTPATQKTDACQKAIDLLHTGALAEQAAFTAQKAGNSADLATAVTTLTNLPSQLAALGVLKAE